MAAQKLTKEDAYEEAEDGDSRKMVDGGDGRLWQWQWDGTHHNTHFVGVVIIILVEGQFVIIMVVHGNHLSCQWRVQISSM